MPSSLAEPCDLCPPACWPVPTAHGLRRYTCLSGQNWEVPTTVLTFCSLSFLLSLLGSSAGVLPAGFFSFIFSFLTCDADGFGGNGRGWWAASGV